MNTILDFSGIETKEALYVYLQQQLKLPDYCGKNLDALYDCLTDIPGEITVTVEHLECLKEALGDYADGLLSVLKDGCAFVDVK